MKFRRMDEDNKKRVGRGARWAASAFCGMALLASCGGSDGGSSAGAGGFGDVDGFSDDEEALIDEILDDIGYEEPVTQWSGSGSVTFAMAGNTETFDDFECVYTGDNGDSWMATPSHELSGEFFQATFTTTPAGVKVQLWDRINDTGAWEFSEPPPAADVFAGSYDVWSSDGQDVLEVDFDCQR